MVRAYGLYASVSRRILGYLFSLLLSLEGAGWIVRRLLMPEDFLVSSLLAESMLNYGPLNIFCAALVFTDSFAIHLRDKFFQFAWMLKISYLLFSASQSISLLAKDIVLGSHRAWVATRLVVTLLWICSCLEDLIWWKDQSLMGLPMMRTKDSSSESDSPVASTISWGGD